MSYSFSNLRKMIPENNIFFYSVLVIAGVRLDCGSEFYGQNHRLTIGQQPQNILQQNRYISSQYSIFHPCINDNQHFDSWGG